MIKILFLKATLAKESVPFAKGNHKYKTHSCIWLLSLPISFLWVNGPWSLPCHTRTRITTIHSEHFSLSQSRTQIWVCIMRMWGFRNELTGKSTWSFKGYEFPERKGPLLEKESRLILLTPHKFINQCNPGFFFEPEAGLTNPQGLSGLGSWGIRGVVWRGRQWLVTVIREFSLPCSIVGNSQFLTLFPNLVVLQPWHQNHLEYLLKGIVGPYPGVSDWVGLGWGQESASLTGFQAWDCWSKATLWELLVSIIAWQTGPSQITPETF